jgi:hypothetical protein
MPIMVEWVASFLVIAAVVDLVAHIWSSVGRCVSDGANDIECFRSGTESGEEDRMIIRMEDYIVRESPKSEGSTRAKAA